jgi:hypothetical protein
MFDCKFYIKTSNLIFQLSCYFILLLCNCYRLLGWFYCFSASFMVSSSYALFSILFYYIYIYIYILESGFSLLFSSSGSGFFFGYFDGSY